MDWISIPSFLKSFTHTSMVYTTFNVGVSLVLTFSLCVSLLLLVLFACLWRQSSYGTNFCFQCLTPCTLPINHSIIVSQTHRYIITHVLGCWKVSHPGLIWNRKLMKRFEIDYVFCCDVKSFTTRYVNNTDHLRLLSFRKNKGRLTFHDSPDSRTNSFAVCV